MAAPNLGNLTGVAKSAFVVALGVLMAGAIMHYGKNVAFIRDIVHDGFDS